MKNIFKIATPFLAFFLVLSCSTKKDAFINRSYHSVTTKYNVLYNGNEALRIGLEQLNSNYEDNFWEVLPIEPLKIDVLALPGMNTDEDNSPQEFEKAEEKAVKAIQIHSMLIARQERNKQIDDAYLLLGKSRYYSKRFVPALEAFNYIVINYPKASLINETKIWQAKTQIRLQNEEQAIEDLKKLLKIQDLPEEISESARTAIAMAYAQIGENQEVINHLNKAVFKTKKNLFIPAMITKNKKVSSEKIISTKNNEQTARNLFILGQLYKEKNAIDSSNSAFQKLIEFKKAPYKYKIQAQIEKAKNVTNPEDELATIELLKKLIKNRDNRPYLGELYYQLGCLQRNQDIEVAIESFKKSIAAKQISKFQKELSYEAAGDLFFEKAQFLKAGSYYDSVLRATESENSKRIRRLARRRNNLNEVILYENIVKTSDSILKLVQMSKEDQTAYFNKYIENLKSKEEKATPIKNTGKGFIFSKDNNKKVSSTWYFYNIQTVGFGEQEFQQIWGNRPLEDNWRLSDKTQFKLADTKLKADEVNLNVVENEKYNVEYYLKNIPTNTIEIDSLYNERNNAYFKLGVIYKEQFKEENLALSKLEKLLTFNPKTALLIPAKYHLYKIYNNQGNAKATILKNDIVLNYPTSKYAKIILNPNASLIQENENSPENIYAEVFYEYKDEMYDSVIKKSTNAISRFEGHEIIPKFELLKAYAIGKKEGIVAFKEALDFVAMNYPNTEEGKKALEVINTIKTKIQ